MSKDALLREEIARLTAYHVPDAADMVKLDAMENPYMLPLSVRESVAKKLLDAPINRYPDAEAKALKQALRISLDIPHEAAVMLGNGSDELIQIISLAFSKQDAVMLGLEPSFAMYPIIAAIAGMRYVGIPLNADFSLDLDRVLHALDEHQPAVVFVAYPNNPTGNLFALEDLLTLIKKAPGIIVIDEAYYAFAQESFMPLLKQYENLMVMRTLSKQGLAGLRLGLIACAPKWHDYLEKLRLPYNVNTLSQIAALEILQYGNILQEQARQIIEQRERLLANLQALPGVEVFPSSANFLLFRVAQATRVFASLKKRGVLIKALHSAHGLLKDCLRVTVGRPAENAIFLTALTESIDETSAS